MNIGIPGSLTTKTRDDGSPIVEYTRQQLIQRSRAISGQLAVLTGEKLDIEALLETQPDAKTFQI